MVCERGTLCLLQPDAPQGKVCPSPQADIKTCVRVIYPELRLESPSVNNPSRKGISVPVHFNKYTEFDKPLSIHDIKQYFTVKFTVVYRQTFELQ